MSPIAAGVLSAYGVQLVVVGSCALVLLGRAKVCADLDIVPDLDADNIDRLGTAFDALGVVDRPNRRTLIGCSVTSVDSAYGRIDVLAERARREYATLLSGATRCPVEDAGVWVASLDDVMRLRTQYGKVPQ